MAVALGASGAAMAAPVFAEGSYVKSLKIDFGILHGPQYSGLAACGTSGSAPCLSKSLTVFEALVMMPRGTPLRRLAVSTSLVDIGKKWQ